MPIWEEEYLFSSNAKKGTRGEQHQKMFLPVRGANYVDMKRDEQSSVSIVLSISENLRQIEAGAASQTSTKTHTGN